MPRIIHEDGNIIYVEDENSLTDTPVEQEIEQASDNATIDSRIERQLNSYIPRPVRYSRVDPLDMDMSGSMSAEPTLNTHMRSENNERDESLGEILDRAINRTRNRYNIPTAETIRATTERLNQSIRNSDRTSQSFILYGRPDERVRETQAAVVERRNHEDMERRRLREEEAHRLEVERAEHTAREERAYEERRRRAEQERDRRRVLENTYRVVYNNNNPRTFGVEIEAFGMERDELCRKLNDNGIVCRVEEYGHATTEHWKLTTDSSIQGDLTFELVSPILSGAAGLEEVEKVLKILNENDIQINASCGFHVHIGMQDMTTSIARNLVKRYAKYEDEIDLFMPESRRDNRNQYCRSIKMHLEELDHLQYDSLHYISDVVTLSGDRRGKINLRSFLRHGTVEFRQHSGTINSKKAVNWILFCLNFVEATINLTNQSEIPTAFNSNTKIGRFYSYLRDGNTIAPYKAAGKFNTTITTIEDMVRKIRRELGVSIRKNRNREYYMVNANNSSMLNGAINDTSVYLGLPNEIKQWFETRSNEMVELTRNLEEQRRNQLREENTIRARQRDYFENSIASAYSSEPSPSRYRFFRRSNRN